MSPGPPDPTCRSDVVTDVAWIQPAKNLNDAKWNNAKWNKMDGLWGKTLLKWMIWGYPNFWKHPYLKNWSFSMGCPFFCWPAPLSLNCWTWGRLRCLEMLWKGWSFFTFPQSWRDDIRPTFQDFKKLSIRCGATKIHRFQQPQVRVPAPTANRPRCRWDPFFFCWKIGIQKLGKRQSPSKPIFLVSILGFFVCFFDWKQVSEGVSKRRNKRYSLYLYQLHVADLEFL